MRLCRIVSTETAMPSDLTAIERRILSVVCRTVAEFGRPPSIKELTKAAELRSVASLHWYLDRLQEKGLIRPHPTRARAIEVDCQDIGLASGDLAAEPAAPATESAHEPSVPGEPVASEGPVRPVSPWAQVPPRAADTEVVPESALVEVPLFGNIAAGDPSLVDAEIHARYDLPVDLVGSSGPFFMLRIRGSSMTGSGILDGDLVVVRQQRDIVDGEIVAVLVGDEEATVKRLSRSGERVRLLADDEHHEPIEPDQASILGKVVTVIRRVR
jgi:repressor LexA